MKAGLGELGVTGEVWLGCSTQLADLHSRVLFEKRDSKARFFLSQLDQLAVYSGGNVEGPKEPSGTKRSLHMNLPCDSYDAYEQDQWSKVWQAFLYT